MDSRNLMFLFILLFAMYEKVSPDPWWVDAGFFVFIGTVVELYHLLKYRWERRHEQKKKV